MRAVSNSCPVYRVRMTCLRDRLYLSSTVRMRTPPLCPLYPVKQQSSGTLRCAGSNASQTSASATEKPASAATGTVRYREGETLGPARGTGVAIHPLLPVFPPQGELRPFLSDPELVGAGDGSSHVSVAVSGGDGYQTLPSRGANSVDPPRQSYIDRACHLGT